MLFNGGMDPNLNPDYNQQEINHEPIGIKNKSVMPKGKVNDLAIWGLILSFLFPLVGLVICIISLRQMKKKGETGKGFAIAGIVVVFMSYVSPLIFMYVVNNYYSNELVKVNYLKPACKMRDEEGKYESDDGFIKCENDNCIYDNGEDRVVLTCK
jgi:hypothetical protein